MKKKLQRALALMLTFCLTMSVFCASVSATEGKTPYWQTTKEVDGVTQTITHAVLDSKGNLVDIGAEPGGLSAKNLDPGNMAAQKFGAF